MKKIIICSILMLFYLNSCYFIEQAYYDEKIARKMPKIKDSIFDTNPIDIREVKNKKKTKVIEINKMNESKYTSSEAETR